MQSQNNLTEIGLIVISSLAIVGAVALLFTGKIDYAGCAGLFGGVFVLWGGHTLYNAPSPIQQAQQAQQQTQQQTQQDTMQQIASQALAVLPTFAGLLHSHQAAPQVTMSAHPIEVPSAPVAPPQAPQTAVPMQSSRVPEVTLTPTPPNFGTITTGLQSAQSPAGTSTTSFVPPVPTRDAWSNSALMQAIGKPPQQQ